MVNKEFLNKIENNFAEIIKQKKILGILLFGSYLNNMETNRSDLDICVVAPKEDAGSLLSFILKNINVNVKKYDIRLFKELPLYIKIQIIENGILIYSPDKLDLYEFFYIYRKFWNDQKHRQMLTKEELLSF